MTTATQDRDQRVAEARVVADAVMYEGYVLFPYRASATKNRYRWQWGVLVPEAQSALGASEPCRATCQLLVRGSEDAELRISTRFLHLLHRQVLDPCGEPVDKLDTGDETHVTWDEGHEREIAGTWTLGELVGEERSVPFELAGEREVEELAGDVGTIVRRVERVVGALSVSAEAVDDGVVRLTVAVRNHTPWSERRAHRDEILRRSLIGTHLLLSADGAAFASAIDPPDWAAPHAATCSNRHVHPVLVGDADRGDDDVVLAAPIILYDHPEVAPESPGPSFDATEVDELLALAVLGLTDEEKREARATDRRAAELIDRTESLPPAVMERLHGTIREFGPAGAGDVDFTPEPEAGVSEEVIEFLGVGEAPIESARRDGIEIRVGSRVLLRPRRRADAHDIFVAGRVAVVEKLVATEDGETFAAVTLEDDPASDLHRWYGRFQYFDLSEVEPIAAEVDT